MVAPARRAGAHAQHEAGDFGRHEGEILGAHARLGGHEDVAELTGDGGDAW